MYKDFPTQPSLSPMLDLSFFWVYTEKFGELTNNFSDRTARHKVCIKISSPNLLHPKILDISLSELTPKSESTNNFTDHTTRHKVCRLFCWILKVWNLWCKGPYHGTTGIVFSPFCQKIILQWKLSLIGVFVENQPQNVL